MPNPESVGLVIRDLNLAFGDKQVLQHLDLAVAAGGIIGLMGASGCGKTSLLRCVAGLAGDRNANAALHWTGGSRPYRTGMVFQEDRLLPWRTVSQNLRLACSALPGHERPTVLAETDSLLGLLGIPEVGSAMPASLSGGMRQRVALVRALLFGRGLQLWDEPFQSLDPGRRLQVATTLRQRFKAQGATVLLASHDSAEVLALCDRILIMVPDDGLTRLEEFPGIADLASSSPGPDHPGFRAARHALEQRLHQLGVEIPA